MPSKMKRNAKKYPSEAAEQERLCEWLNAKNVAYFAVPNGGLRMKRTAASLKRQGVKAGVPDLLIIDHPTMELDGQLVKFVGVALELKRQSERPATPAEDLRDQPFKGASEAQRHWLNKFSQRGWVSMVAYGALDAMLKLVACNILAYEDFSAEERLMLGIVSPEELEQSAQSDPNTHPQTEDEALATLDNPDSSATAQDHAEDGSDIQR